MEINRGLDLILTKSYSTPIHRTPGIPTRKATTITRKLPRVPSFELTDARRCHSLARHRALVGDSLNDEQWCDDLFNPFSNKKTYPKIAVVKNHGPGSEGG